MPDFFTLKFILKVVLTSKLKNMMSGWQVKVWSFISMPDFDVKVSWLHVNGHDKKYYVLLMFWNFEFYKVSVLFWFQKIEKDNTFPKGQGYCCIFDFKRVMTFRKCIFCMFYITYHVMIHPMFKWLYLPYISWEVNHLSVYDRYILCRLFDTRK